MVTLVCTVHVALNQYTSHTPADLISPPPPLQPFDDRTSTECCHSCSSQSASVSCGAFGATGIAIAMYQLAMICDIITLYMV